MEEKSQKFDAYTSMFNRRSSYFFKRLRTSSDDIESNYAGKQQVVSTCDYARSTERRGDGDGVTVAVYRALMILALKYCPLIRSVSRSMMRNATNHSGFRVAFDDVPLPSDHRRRYIRRIVFEIRLRSDIRRYTTVIFCFSLIFTAG